MENNLDSLIKRAFKIRYEETVYPPSQEVWDKVIKRIRRQRKEDLLKRLKPAISAGLILAVLTGFMITFHSPVMAFADKVIKSIEEFASNTLIISKRQRTKVILFK